MTDLNKLGKGALITPPEIKAHHFRLAAEPPRIIDWSKPYLVEKDFTLAQRNQDGSSSCTAQATCYYSEALEKIEHSKEENYSARFNYSQSVVPGGGAYIWKAMSIPLTAGLASADSVRDGMSSEAEMANPNDNHYAVLEARADKYAVLDNHRDIDYLASIIEDYGGFITGFNGRNDMFLPDGTATIPATVDWGHAVYVCGYEIRNGVKCLRFKNSWGPGWGSAGYGFFPEEFIKNGPIFDAYTYAAIQDLDPMSTYRLVKATKDVYRIKDGKKDLFINAKAFQELDGRWDAIETISQTDLDVIPDGNVLVVVTNE